MHCLHRELCCMDWMLCCGVTSAPAVTSHQHLLWHLCFHTEMATNRPLPQTFLQPLSRFSRPSQNRGDRTLLWIRFWLEGVLWQVCSTVQTSFLYISSNAVLLSYHPYLYWSCTFNAFQEPPLCSHSLANWLKRLLSSGRGWLLTHLSSLILSISSFWFKVRSKTHFLFLRSYCRIINLPHSITAMSQDMRRGTEMEERLVSGTIRTHNIKSPSCISVVGGTPKQF